jgi:hypothetical protein
MKYTIAIVDMTGVPVFQELLTLMPAPTLHCSHPSLGGLTPPPLFKPQPWDYNPGPRVYTPPHLKRKMKIMGMTAFYWMD